MAEVIMAGNREAGLKSAEKNKAKDPDFYRKIALLSQDAWERNGRKPRGFSTMDRDRVSEIGTRGGSIGGRNRGKGKKRRGNKDWKGNNPELLESK